MKKQKIITTTISLTAEQREKMREIAIETIGKDSMSGLIVYWLTQYEKKEKS